ncbi:amino acid ABC transporter membrane protein 2 (PAAT family) [Hoeflea marina]|uniref:Amino acid ABC transporter membrane protein 2 (PAAT family) n=1 Tax=Hoeflea marina TaxID=274592 RepID=A0A317PN71_9HYPH|nr:amino acid ABC transporter permease [Hoeflea marina]PWW00497.1 amino acid ABC transporter membrane protein 2 (PAAT family) [Hoeflea marina]
MEFELFHRYGPALLRGFGVTILCWVAGSIGGIVLGFAIACLYRWSWRPVRWLLQAYVELIRGTPFMIQLFILYYGGPYVGLVLSPVQAGILSFVIYGSPYFSEIFRSGFGSIPEGQIEAARCVGLGEAAILRRIVLPQMLVLITAPLTNFIIILSKETAILSVVTVPELLYETQTMAAETFTYVEPFLVLSLCYWLLVVLTSWLGQKVEHRVTRHLRRANA